jgi:penicillin-binding protein 1A
MKRKIKIGLLSVLALALVGFGWLWFAPCGLGGCAPVSELERYRAEGSELLDASGKPFGTLSAADRRALPLDSLPEYLPRAFLAVEDRRFYDHAGVDWKRVGGAMMANVRSGGVAEGGSTITMQLARNLFPDHLPYRERSMRRKLMEIRVARQIERELPKDKILELYLNHIYLGEGAYGVDAAARAYFGKPAAQLTLAEAALLGGLPKAPSKINPREDREAALARRNLVLDEMAKAGYATAEQVAEAKESPIRLRRSRTGTAPRAAYFVERVRRELEERVGDRYTGGLKVHTTLDLAAQRAAEEELARQLDAVEAGGFGAFRHPTYPEAKGETEDGSTPYLQGLVVLMDAQTGAIRALVGGRDYADSRYDRVFQARRQPGSAFKPFVYLAALERGAPPTQRVEDAPVRITLAGGQVWEPKNYTGRFDGPMTLRDALTRSKNAATVRLAQDVGMGAVAETARDLGLTTDVPTNPATALGSADVRPVELTTAYAAFANGGRRVTPHVITRVETADGDVLWSDAELEDGGEALDAGVAFVLTSMLRDVVDRGTGTPVRAAGFRGPAAGKTGTTNDAADVWFVGYTPDLVGTVWMGFDRPEPILGGASGGTLAAPVWGRIMRRVYATRRMPAAWSPPGNVITEQVDRATGMAVDPSCPQQGPVYTEYFVNSLPARQACVTDATYGALAMDSVWGDEEWGSATVPITHDTFAVPATPPGISWPELEEQRRQGTTPTTPIPGSVTTVPPPGGVVPPPATGTGERRAGTPPPATNPPASRPPPAAGGEQEPAEPPPPADPKPEPKVLGRPVEGGTEPPPPPPPSPSAGTETPGGAAP